MTVTTKYDLGEKVYVKSYRGKEVAYILGEIKRISLSSSACGLGIRYTVKYAQEGEWYDTDRWEEDLVCEDLTGAAMPKLIVFEIDKEE